jgi:hypothetical protein
MGGTNGFIFWHRGVFLMSVALAPAVDAALTDGNMRILALVKIDLPGKTVGYHMGGRPHVEGGLTYLPNRFMDAGGFTSGLGNQIGEVMLTFSNVPTADLNDAIASIEAYDYLNAPVTVSFLAGNSDTGEVLGVMVTNFYEIEHVEFVAGALDANGFASLTLEITLETLARRQRDQTHIKRSPEDQKRHNLASDTGFDYAATSPQWSEEWGQR